MQHLYNALKRALPEEQEFFDNVTMFSKELSASGDIDGARTLTKLTLDNATSKNDVGLLNELVRVTFIMAEYDDCIAYCKQLLEVEGGKNAETYSDMARAIYEKGNMDQINGEGIQAVESGLQLDSNNINCLLNKGNIKRIQGDLDEAKSIFEQVLKINPKNFQALNNVGNIQCMKNDVIDACFTYL